MKKYLIGLAVISLLTGTFYFGGCSFKNVEAIKSAAPRVWNDAGYEIVGYEGYQIGTITGTPGGRVWYVVQRKGDPRIRYTGFLSKWFDEYHIYNFHAYDAIAPNNSP